MSYAAVAKSNLPLSKADQPRPDLSLLESRNSTASPAQSDSNINIITQEEAILLRQALDSPPTPAKPILLSDETVPSPFIEPIKDEKVQASIARVEALEKKIRNDLVEAEKKLGGNLKGGVEKVERGVEEVERGVGEKKKVVKKKIGKELEREEAVLKAFLKNHPVLIRSVVGFVNVTLISALSVFSYQHRHLKIWNLKRTSIVTVGLGLLATAQSFAGIWTN